MKNNCYDLLYKFGWFILNYVYIYLCLCELFVYMYGLSREIYFVQVMYIFIVKYIYNKIIKISNGSV